MNALQLLKYRRAVDSGFEPARNMIFRAIHRLSEDLAPPTRKEWSLSPRIDRI